MDRLKNKVAVIYGIGTILLLENLFSVRNKN